MAHTVAFPRGRFLGLLFSFLITPTLTPAGVEPNSTGSLIGPRLLDNERAGTAVFEPAYGETTVRARLADRSCFFMRLPGRWQLIASGEGVSLREPRSEAEVDIALHEASAFTSTSGGDLAASYAAHVQRDYEELLGRPVTATALERVDAPGVYRWRATWSDSNFENAPPALNLERFIIQAGPDAVVEVSFNGFEAREAIGTALATVELRENSDCQFSGR
jgi:hypothetical protein